MQKTRNGPGTYGQKTLDGWSRTPKIEVRIGQVEVKFLFQSAAKPKFLEESSHSHSLNEGLDIFYPKSLLKKLAGQGIDVTNFRPAVTPGGLAAQKARAAVSYHSKEGFQNYLDLSANKKSASRSQSKIVQ